MNDFVAVGVALVVLAGLAWMLYRPKVQNSERYVAGFVGIALVMATITVFGLPI